MKIKLAVAFALAGLFLLGNGAYIYAKARLGQVLLERAWARTRRGESNAKPWGWADTSPIARLEFPAHGGASFIVLNGASGRTMAWGPGHIDGTASPNALGNCAISAHRDTQFSVLRDVRPGEEIVMESSDGARVRYVVKQCRRTTDRDVALLAPSSGRTLTLITCYPFDAVTPGGHGRYVVIAEPTGRHSRDEPISPFAQTNRSAMRITCTFESAAKRVMRRESQSATRDPPRMCEGAA